MQKEKYVKGEVVDGVLRVPLGFTIAYHEGRLQRINPNVDAYKWNPSGYLSSWEAKILNRFHYSWFNLMQDYLLSENFKDVIRSLSKPRPTINDIFRVFLKPVEDYKVIIVGQDPYPNYHANGIAFDTDFSPKPQSWLKIEEVLEDEYGAGELNIKYWVEQGVMMVNSALSVKDGLPGSDTHIWNEFTRTWIQELSGKNPYLVWVFLGKQAQNFTKYVDNIPHVSLLAEHPAKAARENRKWDSAGIFPHINAILKTWNKQEIEWLY